VSDCRRRSERTSRAKKALPAAYHQVFLLLICERGLGHVQSRVNALDLACSFEHVRRSDGAEGAGESGGVAVTSVVNVAAERAIAEAERGVNGCEESERERLERLNGVRTCGAGCV
jgi:hypothetical protein